MRVLQLAVLGRMLVPVLYGECACNEAKHRCRCVCDGRLVELRVGEGSYSLSNVQFHALVIKVGRQSCREAEELQVHALVMRVGR